MDPSLKEVSDRLARLDIEKFGEAKPLQRLPPIPFFSDLNQQELQSLMSRVHTDTDLGLDFVLVQHLSPDHGSPHWREEFHLRF